MRGNKVVGTFSISNGISYCLDTEISLSRPESWSEGVLGKAFSESDGGATGLRDSEYNIQPDHIHMVMIIPPKYAVSAVVGKIKGMTSSELRKKFGWFKLRYSHENVVWSPGYFVSTIGLERDKILRYVEYQQRQDSGQAKLEL